MSIGLKKPEELTNGILFVTTQVDRLKAEDY